MERRYVPTFEEYVDHLDETLRNDPLMVLAKKSEDRYMYPENNMGISSEIEINVIDEILRAKGFVQHEKDHIWESGVPKRVRKWGEYVTVTEDYPHKFRRILTRPNSTMYIQLFIPTNNLKQEIFYRYPETHRDKLTPEDIKIGEFIVKGEYTFHPHGTWGNAVAEQLPNYEKWLDQYKRMKLTDKQRDAVFGTPIDPVRPDSQIGDRIFTQEMLDILRHISKVPGASTFYMSNRSFVIARNNLVLNYDSA